MRRAVVLYGPPAAGKSTITDRLTQIKDVYKHFERLKCGGGRTSGYRMITERQLEAIRSDANEILWENHRYGSTYVVDRSHLTAMIEADNVPVVHLGQVEAVETVTTSVPECAWLVVELACPYDIAAERIGRRGDGDTPARREAFGATAPLPSPDLRIDTSKTSPTAAAALIDRHVSPMMEAGNAAGAAECALRGLYDVPE